MMHDARLETFVISHSYLASAAALPQTPRLSGRMRASMIPQFDPIWDWPWVVLAAAASLAVVLATYPKRIAHLPRGQRRLLLTCGCHLGHSRADHAAPLAGDHRDRSPCPRRIWSSPTNSRSMSVKDGPGGASRRETVLKILEDAQKELDTIRRGNQSSIRRLWQGLSRVVEKFGPRDAGASRRRSATCWTPCPS